MASASLSMRRNLKGISFLFLNIILKCLKTLFPMFQNKKVAKKEFSFFFVIGCLILKKNCPFFNVINHHNLRLYAYLPLLSWCW